MATKEFPTASPRKTGGKRLSGNLKTLDQSRQPPDHVLGVNIGIKTGTTYQDGEHGARRLSKLVQGLFGLVSALPATLPPLLSPADARWLQGEEGCKVIIVIAQHA